MKIKNRKTFFMLGMRCCSANKMLVNRRSASLQIVGHGNFFYRAKFIKLYI